MKTSLAIITLISLAAASAYARVGETVKQVEARYGKAQRVLHEHGSFRELGYGYRGFMVGVSYVGGVCKSEGFARPDVPQLSESDVQQILALSAAPGTTWKLAPDQNRDRLWVRSDGKVVALLNAKKFLQVQEKGFHQPTQ
ncbi:MAG: hypothetical protein ACJ8NS_04800 [Chthoniobacterales bacterium]